VSKGSVDKVVVLNQAALTAKYGAAAPTIDAAITTLIAADMARGLRTQRIRIDDAADMAAVSGAPVIAPGDDQGAKAAIDAIYAALAPDYIFLLDGPDIVPHIKLDPIPGLTDADQAIPSDLPYACAAPFSRRAADFVGPERVVGRLPAAEGAADAALLVSLLQHAAAHAPQPRSQYANYFGISADAWSVSTQLSLAAAFQDHAKLQTAPTATHPGDRRDARPGQPFHQLPRRRHQPAILRRERRRLPRRHAQQTHRRPRQRRRHNRHGRMLLRRAALQPHARRHRRADLHRLPAQRRRGLCRDAASVPGRPAKEDSPAWTRLRDLAMSRGYAEPVAFEVTGGAEFRRSVKALGQKRRIVVAVARHPKPPAGAPPLLSPGSSSGV
jgi:hypothetical protein